MTAKELSEKMIAIQNESKAKQFLLLKQYATEHNPVKIGDVITDHFHTIRVETMGISTEWTSVPIMRYRGTELTKQGVPKKRQPVPSFPVFQRNIVSINGEPYKYVVEKI
jgi:hypothetical protein